MKKTEWIWLAIVLVIFLTGLVLYPRLPDQVASHWNIRGEVDDHMSKTATLFFLPGIGLVLVLVFWAIPRIDPLKKNIAAFRSYYDAFIIILLLFMLGIHLLTLSWGLGHKINPMIAISAGMGVLLFFSGLMMRKAKRNWFIGIRTPWTLSSDTVWDKTHAIGGRLFQAVGILAFVGVFAPRHAIWIFFIPLMAVSLYSVVYSYWLYQKEAHSPKP